MKSRKVQTQAFAMCLAVMTAAQTMSGYAAVQKSEPSYYQGSWLREGESWKYQSSNGSFLTGWVFTASGWYYIDPETGYMKVGKAVIDGKQYYFDRGTEGIEGRMHTGWVKDESGSWYFYSTKSDSTQGSMISGWQWIDGRCYYFEPESGENHGKLFTNGMTPDGYQVNQDGAWLNENGRIQERPGEGYSSVIKETTSSNQSVTSTDNDDDSDSGSSSGGSSSGGSSSGGSSSGGSSSGGSSSGGSSSGGSSSGGSSSGGSSSGGNGSASNGNNNTGDNGASGSGSGSGSGNGTGDENKTPGESDNNSSSKPETAPILVENETRIVDLGWSQCVTVAFAKGYSLSNCNVKIGGVDITSAMTPVDADGTIAKWELTTLDPGEVTVTSKDGQTQTIPLGGSGNGTQSVVLKTGTAPSAFLAHGSVYTWDYQLTNYDDNGNPRVKPSATTFSLGRKKDEIRYYAPKAELVDDETADNIYHVSGSAIVMFNYTTDVDKQWFDNISDVDLVSGNGNKTTINDSLSWTKETTDHHGNTVGQISVPLGQTNFYSNGQYYLRVVSGKTGTLIPIEVVNGTAPSMRLSEAGAIVSGKNLHFTVQNMTYGASMPVNRVELTGPDGSTKELEKIREWYLIGNSFVLYNDEAAENGRNNIPNAGKYTITVHATGFKDMSYTFIVSDSARATMAESSVTYSLTAVDAISSATTGGGSSSGSSDASDGGSTTMSADLIFDADLLTNALILHELGLENEYADAIAERWLYEMSGYDAVIGEDSTKFYRFDAYRNAVEEAKNFGTYLSFSDYISSDTAEATANRPYAVKYVLEDNRLGETQTNSTYLGKEAPALYLTDKNGTPLTEVTEGSEVYISCSDTAYLQTVSEDGRLYVNGDYKELSNTKYEFSEDGLSLFFEAGVFVLDKGTNTLTIKLDGYKDNSISIPVVKAKKEIELSVDDDLKVGESVVITNTADETGDIWKNLTGLSMILPDDTVRNILPDKTESLFEEIGYRIDKNMLILGKDLFKKEGTYKLTITSKYYEEQNVNFSLTKKEGENPGNGGSTDPGESSGQVLAQPTAVESITDGYSLTFADKSRFDSLTSITVNGEPYNKADYLEGGSYRIHSFLPQIILSNSAFRNSFENTVVIAVDGYDDLTVTISLNSKGEIGEEEEGSEKPAPTVSASAIGQWDQYYTVKASSENLDDWFNSIKEITINGNELTQVTYSWDLVENTYILKPSDREVRFGKGSLSEAQNAVVISAEGYEALEFYLDGNGAMIDPDSSTATISLANVLNAVNETVPDAAADSSDKNTGTDNDSNKIADSSDGNTGNDNDSNKAADSSDGNTGNDNDSNKAADSSDGNTGNDSDSNKAADSLGEFNEIDNEVNTSNGDSMINTMDKNKAVDAAIDSTADNME